MLRFKELEVYNFGPYKGHQHVQFPAEEGVVVVYGDNMRGKTSLLNAFRYALFGRVVGRGSREIELKKVENWEAAAEGDYGLGTTLVFQAEGHDYELRRSWTPREGVQHPSDEMDYRENVYLLRDGDALSPSERDRELESIMPEQISRFFLFDGELLQQYEELLREESEMGYKIKEAIERILGVPVLQRARTHVAKLHGDAQKELSQAAQREKKTREIGNHLENLEERETRHRENIESARTQLKEWEQKKRALKEDLRRVDKYAALLNERDSLRDDIKHIETQLSEQGDRLQLRLREGWLAILQPDLKDRIEEMKDRLDEVRETLSELRSAQESVEAAKRGLESSECPTCGAELTAGGRERLEEELERSQRKIGESDPVSELERRDKELRDQLELLTGLVERPNTELMIEISDRIDSWVIEKASKEARIREIDDEFGDLDQTEVRKTEAELEKTQQQIARLSDGLSAEQERLEDAKSRIRKLTKELEKTSGGALASYKTRTRVYERLHDLFDDSIGAYRDRLRTRVEADASSLFRKLTSEPEYERVAINDNYGLTIIHRDGSDIPVRSAGAEHVVALSLMGALQRNAPLRGPIIMDSPFGRLDDKHTRNVVGSLPSMAMQTMLLVFESELDPQLVRSELGSHLFREYRMERKSAKHTELAIL